MENEIIPFVVREPVSSGSHLLFFLLSIPASIFLLKITKYKTSIILYTITLLCCYGASALYHGTYYYAEELKHLDLICIFLLIGGSYTAILGCTQTGKQLIIANTIVWILVWIGVCAFLIHGKIIKELYIIVGVMPSIYPAVFITYIKKENRLVMCGSLIYIIGAFLEYSKNINLIPGIVNSHELFHLLVMVASLCHYIFLLQRGILSREGGGAQNFHACAAPSSPTLASISASPASLLIDK